MHSERFRNILLTVLILVLIAGLAALMLYVKTREDAREDALKQISAQVEAQRDIAEETAPPEEELPPERTPEEAANDSFYQKLANGTDVNILIVGDSIGAATGAELANLNWISCLQLELMRQYTRRWTPSRPLRPTTPP